MKVIAVNGSPRRSWNTAMLLTQALEGAATQGAETELIHLADFRYQGCISCFSCKRKENGSGTECAVKDALAPVLEKANGADVLLLGAPIYLGTVNSFMQAFLERFVFPYVSYDAPSDADLKKNARVGFIYTLGATEERMKAAGYDKRAEFNKWMLDRMFSYSEFLLVNDTYQFDDYSKYRASGVDAAHKVKRRQEVFPEDCRMAFDMGVRLAGLV